MTIFRRITDGAYPIGEQFIRSENPNTSFPINIPIDVFLDLGYEPVFEVPKPEVKQWQMAVELAPVKDSKDKWIMAWEVVDMPFNPITDENGDILKSSDQVRAEYVEYLKTNLKTQVTNIRYSKETNGITLDDHTIKTDRESQTMLNNAYAALKSELITSTDWKITADNWITVTLTELEPIAKAVAIHVSTCFNVEKTHLEAIAELSTFEEIDNYDINANWPQGI
jgi:Domain of unknown function (DUF4376)